MAGTIKEIAERAGVSRGTVDRALNNRGRIKPEVAERILAIAKELDYHSNGTIKEIAERAGVSRGTVDRALNNRGRIKPEVAERILAIAKELDYHSNRKSKKNTQNPDKHIKIGVITQLSEASFMIPVKEGIRDAGRELEYLGVELLLKDIESVDEEAQMEAIDELESKGIDGLAIMPVQSEYVRERLNRLMEEKEIPVVTFNSDIVGTKRSCFVGLDNKKSGRTAAGLMGMLTRGKGKVLVITGFFTNSVNSLRVEGFVQEIKNAYPDMELLGVQSSFDETREVQKIIENTMAIAPDLSGVFVASGGQAGVCLAFEKLKLEKRPYVIVYDATPKNTKALKEDRYDFLIDQEGYEQGYRPPNLLYNMIQKGQMPETDHIYTDIKIKNKYNV